jgi:soluble lytic murein transglycosylase-like protein
MTKQIRLSIVVAFFLLFMMPICVHAHSITSRNQVAFLLHDIATQHGLSSSLLKAITWKESHWNQSARGSSREIGIAQMLPSTAMMINIRAGTHYDPYTVQGNITLATIYLKSLWSYFGGNLIKTISAYNAGQETVVRRGIVNWGYVNSILALMRTF